jgi:hypothetical protein
MVVKIQSRGRLVTGLNVGVNNVRRYFPKHLSFIQLEFDHLQIECKLTPEFWRGDGEIQDPRLTLWLESKSSGRPACQTPVHLTMIRSGNNCFRLRAISLSMRSPARSLPATAA